MPASSKAWVACWPVASVVPSPSKSHSYSSSLTGVRSSKDMLPSKMTFSPTSTVVSRTWPIAVGAPLVSWP